jgi:ribose transport system ATP-binding protein
VIRELKTAGVSIIYISHRLMEVKTLADRALVLRDGKYSGELPQAEINANNLVRLMVGRELQQLHQRKHRAIAPAGASPGVFSPAVDPRPLLRVQNLRWSVRQVRGVSFDVRAGEIVCLAGLVGAGRTELAEALLGLRPALGGLVELHGRDVPLNAINRSLGAGMFLVPEDRRRQGLILSDSVCRNIGLASLRRLGRLGLVDFRAERRLAQEMKDKLAIRTPSLSQCVGLLSGGNQQKVVLAKGLARGPRLLILDEPTRGVDVGAKAEIYGIMDQLAGEGVGILMISSDLEEVLGMSDRALVMHEGQLAGELPRDRLSEEAVMRLATGASAMMVGK